MHRPQLLVSSCTLVALAAASVVHAPMGAAESSPPVHVVATGLSSPKGLATNDARDLIVAQGAFGAPGPVMVFPRKGAPFEATGPVNLTDVAISPADGTGWGIGPADVGGEEHGMLFHQLSDGTIETVLDITAYQVTDPDPVDNDEPPNPAESNPYGLTVMDNGDALVADAAGNDIIRVSPDGDAFTLARFDLEMISTDHLSGPTGLPPTIPAEAVPTSVTVGPDGAIYVGELKGFPFRPRSSRIWRIEPDANGAWCSVDGPDDCSTFRRGLTAIQDIAFNPRTGKYYVYELARGGVFAFEEGFATGVFPPAVLLEVNGAQRRELAAGQLSEPGGVVITDDNKVYVTDGVFNAEPAVNDGRLVRVVG